MNTPRTNKKRMLMPEIVIQECHEKIAWHEEKIEKLWQKIAEAEGALGL